MTLRISGLLAPAAFAAACCKRPNARSALPQGRKRAEVGSGRWQWRATAASAVTFAFGLFQPAHAQVTYYYTGNPFVASAAPDVSPQGCSFYIPDPCINGHVTGTVIYNSPGPGDFSFTLTANGVTLKSNNYNAPSSYVATSGVCELGAEFFVQNGIPTAWDLELVSSETPVSNFAYITTLDGVGRGVPAGAGSDEALFGQGYLGALNITAVGATQLPRSLDYDPANLRANPHGCRGLGRFKWAERLDYWGAHNNPGHIRSKLRDDPSASSDGL